MHQNNLELSRDEVDAMVIAELRRRFPDALPMSVDYEPRTDGGFCHVWWVSSLAPAAAALRCASVTCQLAGVHLSSCPAKGKPDVL